MNQDMEKEHVSYGHFSDGLPLLKQLKRSPLDPFESQERQKISALMYT